MSQSDADANFDGDPTNSEAQTDDEKISLKASQEMGKQINKTTFSRGNLLQPVLGTLYRVTT